jgi:hypothetical protein
MLKRARREFAPARLSLNNPGGLLESSVGVTKQI